MKKIGILNLEPKYKNLALEKCRLYHTNKGDIVNDCFIADCDLVYCSSIFDFTKRDGLIPPTAICGGTGFDLITKLPPEIEATEPHLNFGYTTRGCFRNCPFCVVRLKEGYIYAVGDILMLWDGKSPDIVLLDNNPLGLMEHFAMNCGQARQYNLRLDWNQGLDHRCLTPESLDLIQSVRHHELRFAFDHRSLINSVDKSITLLQSKGINRCNWYVLIGFDSTLEDDLFRLNYLRDRNQIAYVQRFKGKQKPKIERPEIELIALARWVNQHHLYRGMTWEQFLQHPDNKRYLPLLKQETAGALIE